MLFSNKNLQNKVHKSLQDRINRQYKTRRSGDLERDARCPHLASNFQRTSKWDALTALAPLGLVLLPED